MWGLPTKQVVLIEDEHLTQPSLTCITESRENSLINKVANSRDRNLYVEYLAQARLSSVIHLI